jgi:hypothetical protein
MDKVKIKKEPRFQINEKMVRQLQLRFSPAFPKQANFIGHSMKTAWWKKPKHVAVLIFNYLLTVFT